MFYVEHKPRSVGWTVLGGRSADRSAFAIACQSMHSAFAKIRGSYKLSLRATHCPFYPIPPKNHKLSCCFWTECGRGQVARNPGF